MKFKRKSKTVDTNKNTNAPSVTFITKGTEIKADMFCKDDIRVAGFIKGQVETKQKLFLAESGKIEGTVLSTEADISGKVHGDVRGSTKLTLRSSAVIQGQIFTKKITIENGAQIKGALQVGPDIEINGSEAKPASSSASFFKKNKSENKPEEKAGTEDQDQFIKDNDDSAASSGSSKTSE